MITIPTPTYNPNDFRPDRDRYAEHISEVAPWKSVYVQKIYKKQFRSGWAQDLAIHFYIRVPYELVQNANVIVHFNEESMTILQGTRPAFTKFKTEQSMELLAYFEWLGG